MKSSASDTASFQDGTNYRRLGKSGSYIQSISSV